MNNKQLNITDSISIPYDDLDFQAIRSQGPGGQHVNKVSTAIQLKYDFENSDLPEEIKRQLRKMKDNRITKSGFIIIKAQSFSSQKKNKDEAIDRFVKIISNTLIKKKKRIPTKPTSSSKKKRMDEKTKRGKTKELRKRVDG